MPTGGRCMRDVVINALPFFAMMRSVTGQSLIAWPRRFAQPRRSRHLRRLYRTAYKWAALLQDVGLERDSSQRFHAGTADRHGGAVRENQGTGSSFLRDDLHDVLHVDEVRAVHALEVRG